MLRPFIAIGFLSLATAAFADPAPVGGDELKKCIPGSLVEIDTPLGTKMPIRFSGDGLISAEAGDLAPILGSAKDRGRWWVDGDKLCSKFFRWFDAEPRCITLARDGTRLYWRKDDGETGTATIVEQTLPGATQQTVVAKAEPQPAKIKTAAEPMKPAPTPEQKAASSAEKNVPTPASQPIVVASADAASASAMPQDGPTMKFGGTGLLDASSRVGPQGPVRPLEKRAAPKKVEPQRAAQAKAAAPKKAADKETVVAQLPAAPRADGASVRSPGQTRSLTASEMFAATEDARPREVAISPAATASRYRVTGVSRGDVLNVRRGPSEQHEQIAGIPPKGRSVEITGRCVADWCPVRYGKIKGWVNSYYLVAEGARVGSSSPVYVAKP